MPYSPDDYTVACICPMGIELAPVQAMLDERHPALSVRRDYNNYTLGSIGHHNVVIAVLPKIGFSAASKVALEVMEDFPAIRFGLLVGLGGGVPDDEEDEEDGYDIRLGDVVVSKPVKENAGVVQYNVEKYLAFGEVEQTGVLREPPSILLSTVQKLAARHDLLGSQVPDYLAMMMQRFPKMEEKYTNPGIKHDQLFVSSYSHVGGRTCRDCDRQYTVKRKERRTDQIRFHYGTIASANMVIRDVTLRDQLRHKFNVKCVEMEAAGLMESFPCLVIRGICDYADSHKSKKWQPYAAATAAGYFKELLSEIVPREVVAMTRAIDVVRAAVDLDEYKLGLHFHDAPDISDRLFIGRRTHLEELENILTPGGHVQYRRVVVLGGMGGSGKTQLAIAYAKRHCHYYSSIFWLNAASEVTLNISLRYVVEQILSKAPRARIASATSDEQARKLFLSWFSRYQNTRWLLIFDNYDDPNAFNIRSYYPTAFQGNVIVTTRRPNHVMGDEVRVQPNVNEWEGLQILRTRSGRQITDNDLDARRIVNRLGGLPLALASAGMYLRNHFISFEDYLSEYEKRWDMDPPNSIRLLDYHADKTLYTTWDISYVTLKRNDPDAAEMLKILAYFDNQNIQYELLSAGIDDDSPQWLLDAMASPLAFEDLMKRLVDYCFVDAHSESRSYSVHLCVHDWVLAQLNSDLSLTSYLFASRCIQGSVSHEESFIGLSSIKYTNLVPHAIRLTHHRFTEIHQRDSHLVCSWRTLRNIATLLYMQMQLSAAEMMYLQVLSAQEVSLGCEHIETISTINKLGSLYHRLGDLAKAKAMLTRALAVRREASEAGASVTVETLRYTALLCCELEQLEEAEQICTQAVTVAKSLYGPQHCFTYLSLCSLARVHRKKGNLDSAEQILNGLLSGMETNLGSLHPDTLNFILELGVVHMMKNKLAQAEQGFNQAITGFEQTIGPMQDWTLRALRMLGILYVRQGRLREAEATFLRVLTGCATTLGHYDRFTKWNAYRLALVYNELDEVELADELLKEYDIDEEIRSQEDKKIRAGM